MVASAGSCRAGGCGRQKRGVGEMGDGGRSTVLTAVGDACTAADDVRGGAADLAGGGCRVFWGCVDSEQQSSMANASVCRAQRARGSEGEVDGAAYGMREGATGRSCYEELVVRKARPKAD